MYTNVYVIRLTYYDERGVSHNVERRLGHTQVAECEGDLISLIFRDLRHELYQYLTNIKSFKGLRPKE